MEKVIILDMKVVPRASETEFSGRMANGTLKIRLKAPPANGKANVELIKFFSKEFKTTVVNIEILSGKTSRRKKVKIKHPGKIPDWMDTSRKTD